jgi:ABC-2 type transport system permease protein
MRYSALAARNRKELVRDPLTLAFGIGLPLILLLLMSTVQKSVPIPVFAIERLAPGMAVFSLSFIALFSGMLVAKDRSTSFLMRLFASPLTAADYIVGYALPMLLVAALQSGVCFVASFIFGLIATVNVLLTMLVLAPSALLFTGLGLLLGTLLNDKQVGGIGSIVIQVATLLGGTWFDLNMIGGSLRTISYALPFAHAIDAARAALSGDFGAIMPHLWWVLGYAVVLFALAVTAFRRKMTSGNV